MHTLIELYDKKPIHNVLATEVFRPLRTVFLCPPSISKTQQESLKQYFLSRGCSSQLVFIPVDMNNARDVARHLETVINRYDDCAVDIAGGTDAALFAAGSVCSRMDIAAFTYSRRRNTFYEIQRAPYASSLYCDVHLRVPDVFLMAGGSALQGRMDNEALSAIENMIYPFFQLYFTHRQIWTNQITYFQSISQEKGLHAEGPLALKEKHGRVISADQSMLRQLSNIGLLTDLKITRNKVSFTFLNEIARFALRDVGSVLELYIWKACREAGVFDDICLSTIVNWEGRTVRSDSVTNEIDVACTRGVMPLFISCKTCAIKTEALNELAVLRDRFGAPTARALIVSSVRTSHERGAMRNRASELDIAVIEQDELKPEIVQERLRILSEMKDKL